MEGREQSSLQDLAMGGGVFLVLVALFRYVLRLIILASIYYNIINFGCLENLSEGWYTMGVVLSSRGAHWE